MFFFGDPFDWFKLSYEFFNTVLNKIFEDLPSHSLFVTLNDVIVMPSVKYTSEILYVFFTNYFNYVKQKIF